MIYVYIAYFYCFFVIKKAKKEGLNMSACLKGFLKRKLSPESARLLLQYLYSPKHRLLKT